MRYSNTKTLTTAFKPWNGGKFRLQFYKISDFLKSTAAFVSPKHLCQEIAVDFAWFSSQVYNVRFDKRPGEARAVVVAVRPICAGEAPIGSTTVALQAGQCVSTSFLLLLVRHLLLVAMHLLLLASCYY